MHAPTIQSPWNPQIPFILTLEVVWDPHMGSLRKALVEVENPHSLFPNTYCSLKLNLENRILLYGPL